MRPDKHACLTHHAELPVLEDHVGVLAHLPGENHAEEAAHGGHVRAAGRLGAGWMGVGGGL